VDTMKVLPRVLIAEDAKVMRLKLKRFLEQEMGVEVLVAEDGDQAWEIFQQQDVRFVISDWMMPGCDGPDLCQRIRSVTDRPYTYFILVTSRSEKEDLLEGMASGADDYVTKPYDEAELQSRVNAGFRVVRLEQTLAEKTAQIEEALYSASQVQQRMLPDQRRLVTLKQSLGLDVVYRYVTSHTVGGDVLGMVDKQESGVALFLADVSGHGIAASLAAVSLQTYLFTLLREIDDPLEIAQRTNMFCSKDLPEHIYATFVYLCLYPRLGYGRVLVAGHPPVLHLSADGSARIHESRVPPMGLFDQLPDDIEADDFAMAPGERFLVYTDGVVETRNAAGEFFDTGILLDSFTSARRTPLGEIPELIVGKLADWRGRGIEADDDITLLAAGFDGVPE
jgi:phosphoserine phosphatase RsbU/P